MKKIKEYLLKVWSVLIVLIGKIKRVVFDFNGHTEFKVGVWSLFGFLIFWVICVIFGIAPFPLATIIKPVFGLFSATVIMTALWWIFSKGYKVFKVLIDPEGLDEEKELTKWEKTKLAFWFFALYAGIAVYSASQL